MGGVANVMGARKDCAVLWMTLGVGGSEVEVAAIISLAIVAE